MTEQELIVHLFAPIEGPQASSAQQQLRAVWDRAARLLELDNPIVRTRSPITFPEDLSVARPGVPLAAREDRQVDHQMVIRRRQASINLSLVFAAPLPTDERRLSVGSAAPPGWIEFTRDWHEISESGLDALTAVGLLYQATNAQVVTAALADISAMALPHLPVDLRERDQWDQGHRRADWLAMWESVTDLAAERRLLLLSAPDRHGEQSALTWSERGSAELPPLAVYLDHAGESRRHARAVSRDQRRVRRVRAEVDELVARLHEAPGTAVVVDRLRDVESRLVRLIAEYKEKALAVRIAGDNMRNALGDPLRGDAGLIEWMLAHVDDTISALDISRDLAQASRSLSNENVTTRSRPAQPSDDDAVRVGFSVDIVGYSTRDARRKTRLQQRLAVLLDGVLGDLGLSIPETHHQGTGDGMVVFLPSTVGMARAVRVLLRSTRDRLEDDNGEHADRMRLRMAVTLGPAGRTALGFGNGAVVTLARLLDSPALRAAVTDIPQNDLAAMISDALWQLMVEEHAHELDDFRCYPVESKGYKANGWLWTDVSGH